MDEPDVLGLLARPVAFHPAFVQLTGSVDAAIMLSQAFYWLPRVRPEAGGWFYKTRVEWQEETALSRSAQETARKHLRECSFWQEERRGNPAQMFYRLDRQLLNRALLQMAGFQPSKDGAVLANKIVGIKPTPRARPLTSTESTATKRKHATIARQTPEEPPQIPPPFSGEEFLQVLSEFETMRKRLKKALVGDGRKRMFARLEMWGEKVSTHALEESVTNNWIGVFLPKNGSSNGAMPNPAKCDPDRPMWMAGQRK